MYIFQRKLQRGNSNYKIKFKKIYILLYFFFNFTVIKDIYLEIVNISLYCFWYLFFSYANRWENFSVQLSDVPACELF